jgi:hypothetical protein
MIKIDMRRIIRCMRAPSSLAYKMRQDVSTGNRICVTGPLTHLCGATRIAPQQR